MSSGTLSLSLSMPRAWLPVHCLLLAGQDRLQRSTYCYLRYQLYDRDAFYTPLRHPALQEAEEEDVEEAEGGRLATVSFQGSREVRLRRCRPLLWYLREERLELQLWVAFGKRKTPRPHDTDRLVGSAFVDLSPLAEGPGQKKSLSGMNHGGNYALVLINGLHPGDEISNVIFFCIRFSQEFTRCSGTLLQI